MHLWKQEKKKHCKWDVNVASVCFFLLTKEVKKNLSDQNGLFMVFSFICFIPDDIISQYWLITNRMVSVCMLSNMHR